MQELSQDVVVGAASQRMSAEVQVYQQPRSHFEIYSNLMHTQKTLGTRLDIQWNWPRDYQVPLHRGFFYIYFTILGVKKIVRYIENQKREAQNQKSAQRLLQSHDSEQRVLFFHNNISASHTSLVRSGLQMLLNLCRNHNII